MFLMVFSYT